MAQHRTRSTLRGNKNIPLLFCNSKVYHWLRNTAALNYSYFLNQSNVPTSLVLSDLSTKINFASH